MKIKKGDIIKATNLVSGSVYEDIEVTGVTADEVKGEDEYNSYKFPLKFWKIEKTN